MARGMAIDSMDFLVSVDREKIDWRERVAETSKNRGKPGRGERF